MTPLGEYRLEELNQTKRALGGMTRIQQEINGGGAPDWWRPQHDGALVDGLCCASNVLDRIIEQYIEEPMMRPTGYAPGDE